jgi:hypothetical protein
MERFSIFKASFKFADGIRSLTVVKLNVPLSKDKFEAIRRDFEAIGAFYSRKTGVHGFVFEREPDLSLVKTVIDKYAT